MDARCGGGRDGDDSSDGSQDPKMIKDPILGESSLNEIECVSAQNEKCT